MGLTVERLVFDPGHARGQEPWGVGAQVVSWAALVRDTCVVYASSDSGLLPTSSASSLGSWCLQRGPTTELDNSNRLRSTVCSFLQSTRVCSLAFVNICCRIHIQGKEETERKTNITRCAECQSGLF